MVPQLIIAAIGAAAAVANARPGEVAHAAAAPRAYAAARPAWQQGTLRAPQLTGEVVMLPPARPMPAAPHASGELKPMERIVGYVEPLPDDALPSWPWQPLADGAHAARVELISPNACGLRVRFEHLDAGTDIEIRLFDVAGQTVFGPFMRPAADEDGGWWSPTIWSDSLGIEVYTRDAARLGMRQPRVAKVAYLPLEGNCNLSPDATLNCHNDVNCFPSFDDESRGVALIWYVSGSRCGQCSGTLLNRQPGDLSPLFLTASHCVSTHSEAASLEAYWFYETSGCGGSAPGNPGGQPLTLGATLLKRHSDSDTTLLGLLEPPVADVVYEGWNSGSWSNNETASGIHHPQGSFKRISFGDTGGTSNREFCSGGCIFADVRNVNFDDGTTEGGSSGSPVFDGDRLIRGVLTGGEEGCPSQSIDKYYGRFDLAYDHLRFFMGDDDIASPVYVDNTVSGDSLNDGVHEKGTSAAPFNALREATFAVRSGDEVRIEPGTYSQTQRIWRPMTLKRKGTTGTVRIGG